MVDTDFIVTGPYFSEEQKRDRYIKKELLPAPPVTCDLAVGNWVTFTNDYGFKFYNVKVVGFSDEPYFLSREMFVHLDLRAYWFPHNIKQCELQKGYLTQHEEVA